MPDMTSLGPSLPAEVWLRIIGYLRRPLPTPNGKNDRSSVVQPDLAVTMRVNTLFNNLTSIPLYRSVVTDHLPSLIYNLDLPAAAPGIRSKSDLISSIVALHLEYCNKSRPSYLTIMAVGSESCWRRVGEGLGSLCEAESENIAEAAGRLLEGGTIRLESCRTISTGAYLGGQTGIWKRVCKSDPVYLDSIYAARSNITNLTKGPTMKSYCQRVDFGPLSFAAVAWVENVQGGRADLGLSVQTHQAHLDQPSALETLPTVVGNISQWYCQFKENAFNSDRDDVLWLAVANRIYAREHTRRWLEERREEGDYSDISAISVDIFLPAAVYTGGGRSRLEEDIATIVSHTLETEFGVVGPAALSAKYASQWNLREIESAPSCQACGWCGDDL